LWAKQKYTEIIARIIHALFLVQIGVDKMTQFDVLTLIYATLELLWEIRIKQVDMDTIDTLDQAMDKLRKIRHAALKRKIV